MPLEAYPKSFVQRCHLVVRICAGHVALCLLAISLEAGELIAQTKGRGDAGELRPGVIFHAESSLIFIMRPGGGSEATKIDDGETVWVSESADKPLIATQDRLLAQSETGDGSLVLTMVALGSGEPFGRLQAELPEGVVALIDDQLDRSFEIEARGAEDVILHWTATVQPVAAVERLQKEAMITEGILRVDWDAETVEQLDLAEYAGLFLEPPPNLTDNERVKSTSGVQFRSVAGNAILMTEQIADNRTWDKYQWSLIDPTNGELIGQFVDFQRYSRFAILGHVLLQEVAQHVRITGQQPISFPLSVRGINLNEGREIWKRPIRDTTYRGPLPH